LRWQIGLTLLLSERNLHFALGHAERIHLIGRARIAWHGLTAEFTDNIAARYL
jgi:ABC-type branched-subunit amino acid transport system ATPase component